VLLRQKLLCRSPVGIHQRSEIEIEREPPALVGDFVQWTIPMLSPAAAGDVIDRIEPTKLFDGQRDGFGRGVGMHGIALQDRSRGAKFLPGAGTGFWIAADYDHAGPFPDAGPACRQTQPGGAPDDHNRFSFQPHGRSLTRVSCLASIFPRTALKSDMISVWADRSPIT